jgi:ABC-type phosphate/phosphonate transport system permease subunit
MTKTKWKLSSEPGFGGEKSQREFFRVWLSLAFVFSKFLDNEKNPKTWLQTWIRQLLSPRSRNFPWKNAYSCSFSSLLVAYVWIFSKFPDFFGWAAVYETFVQICTKYRTNIKLVTTLMLTTLIVTTLITVILIENLFLHYF